MSFLRVQAGVVMAASLLLIGVARAEIIAPPNYQEVLEIVRAQLPGTDAAKLGEGNLQTLLDQLRGQAMLVTNEPAAASPQTPGVKKTAVFDGAFGYIRVGQVNPALGRELSEALEKLRGTSKLKGLVMDVRFATGHAYEAAGEVASLFSETEELLFKIGETSVRSSASSIATNLPVAVLINNETSGAAEALAAVLRQSEGSLLIGTGTAGRAHGFKDFHLSNGQTLKIASASVELRDGQRLSTNGVKPDIQAASSGAEELAYLEDPYRPARGGVSSSRTAQTTATGRAQPARRRINEAELVRMRREGLEAAEETVPATVLDEPSPPVIQDPVLGRALDLLKGISIAQGRK